MSGEFELIERIKARAAPRPDVILGIGDDAALLQVPDGHQLVLSTDTLIAGVHFPDDTAAQDIGWKALAVNLSDLAAMGAEPAWISLALTMPEADAEWLDAFLDGFCELASEHRVALVGGDTTRGPLSITIAAHGFVPAGMALRRDGAGFNDDIWVTGTLGDAAGALSQWRGNGLMSAKLRHRLDRPTPRIAAGIALRELANAAIDVSDGLVADLGHILRRSGGRSRHPAIAPGIALGRCSRRGSTSSIHGVVPPPSPASRDTGASLHGVGAQLDLGRLPTSRALAEHFPREAERWRLQLVVGDDYELCFTAAPANALAIEQAMAACDTAATVVGRITAETGLHLRTAEGAAFELGANGYQHFSERSN